MSSTADTDAADVGDDPGDGVHPLVADVNRVLADIDCLPYRIRRTGEETVTVLIAKNEGRVRGTLDRQGYETDDSDVPVRDGYEALLEVSR
ncbi:hypothetical protein [Halococcus saccharolyticus]|uniref:Uncharacterized protein n=1 Tax=Halococcus saccharolyticus DSM 5350 TaxID=1227455 RepID=M0MDD8_9EURY|nr:hypothetical protein [Halococcus saccharolyticus]EMA42674.1 hypothetical protein C449_16068 [Halococcus saccharolyticus DSM 5350]